MIGFKHFISESIVDKMEGALKEVKEALKEKSIYKPRYEELKNIIDRSIDALYTKEVKEPYVYKLAQQYSNHPDSKLIDLLWASVASARDVVSLGKKLKAVKTKDSPLYIASEKFYKKHIDDATNVVELKQHIVTATQKRAEVKQAKEVEQKKKFKDSSSLVDVLSKFIDEFVKQAEKVAARYYDQTIAEVENAGGLDSIAPRPNSKMSASAYKSAAAKRSFYDTMLRTNRSAYINSESKAAHADYMAWIAKITDKIGKPVVDAKMTGSPWTGSTIHVITNDAEQQTWNTKMIINISKYGRLFNQFPSRKKDR